MKSLLSLLGLALFTSATLAQEATTLATPHITVTGTAVTEVTPDLLLWSVALRNTGPELAAVADLHAEKLGQLLQTLKALGVDSATVQTSQMEFGENRVYRNQEQVKDGYFASTNVSFKLTELSKYKDVWLRLSTMNELSINSVSYDHSKRIDLTIETRKKALTAAKEKAITMAETLDTKTGEVLSIREESDAFQPYAAANRMISSNVINAPVFGGGGDGGALAPGAIPIRCQVVVTFKLVGQAK